MKSFIFLLCVGLSSVLSLHAWECFEVSPEVCLEGRISYFTPFAKKPRKVYHQGWALYELQVSKPFCNDWKGWFGGSWSGVHGHSTCLHNKSHLQLGALRLGLQKEFCLSRCFQFYLGGGLSYNFLKIHDKSHHVKEHSSKNVPGAIVQTGINYHFSERYFLNLNLEYLYQKFHFSGTTHKHVHRHSLNLSGITAGAGFGIIF